MCKGFYHAQHIPFCESQFIQFESHWIGGGDVVNVRKDALASLIKK